MQFWDLLQQSLFCDHDVLFNSFTSIVWNYENKGCNSGYFQMFFFFKMVQNKLPIKGFF